MRNLTGREASVLAFLAAHDSVSEKEKDALIASLSGDAKKIAMALVGRCPPQNKEIRKAIQGLTDWVNSFRKGATNAYGR